MSDVILFGEPMTMFIADDYGSLEDVEHFTKSLAGAEVNVSIGLTRLGYKVNYITKLGSDPMGLYIKKFLEKESIGTEFIAFDPIYKTGFQLKSKVKEGDPAVAYFRKGSAASHLSVNEINAIDLNGIKLIHITGIPPALSLSCREATYRLIQRAKENHITLSFDPNLRPSLWENEETMIEVINDIAMHCDFFLPGIKEGMILCKKSTPEEIADFYHKKGIKTVIVKLGADGSYLSSATIKTFIPGFKVDQVIDTVGAGDGFATGIISGLLDNVPIEEAVIRGNAIGSIQVTHISDNQGLPTRKQLFDYIQKEKAE